MDNDALSGISFSAIAGGRLAVLDGALFGTKGSGIGVLVTEVNSHGDGTVWLQNPVAFNRAVLHFRLDQEAIATLTLQAHVHDLALKICRLSAPIAALPSRVD